MDGTLIRVCDVETTGLTAADAVVELGSCDLIRDGDAWSDPVPCWSFPVNPQRPIPPEASAIHHIVDTDVATAPLWPVVQARLYDDGPDFYAAHGAKFEQQFITIPEHARWICTYKCALTLAPNAPGWSNQILRYWLKLDVDRVQASPPHRAGPDAYVTAHLLRRMLAKATPEQLADITARPVLLPRLTFGKHTMQPCAEVPASYWRWILDKSDIDDEDVRHTAFTYLQKERGVG